MNLKDYLIKTIKEPISLYHLMKISSQHDSFGYYKQYNQFNTNSDFLTSPEISSVFGEMIAIWIIANIKNKTKVDIIELGAGSGILMYDILCTLQKLKYLDKIQNIFILDSNKAARKQQEKNLKNFKNISWYENIEDIKPSNYTIALSNEFFDSLPIHQYKKDDKSNIWEKYIHVNKGNLEYYYQAVKEIDPLMEEDLKNIPINGFYEYSPDMIYIWNKLLKIITENNGLILTVDYAYIFNKYIESLRGFKLHKLYYGNDILMNIDNMDITSNVNFNKILDYIDSNIFAVHYMTQREFLISLGIEHRKQLNKSILNYLIADDAMGFKFKVLIVETLLK